ncbi:glycosyltransferase family protein [Desulfosoma caldarium]|uniref:Putative glycosyltransferase n=1 Tax=Desulfosoma caldarium TaxID=610254 RepID=A0A3N1UTH3_9BACT|nr:glycosyltransferase [Desulfosoma caldarium]ROQ93433.1 putative glycosyltransferase [Desulfosoma caldarium]
MKILQYCQHVLGIGHFLRSMLIAEAFSDHELYFVEGGQPLPGFRASSHVRRIALPPLMMDPQFTALETDRGDVREVQEARQKILLDLHDAIQPDVLLLELFPFGRKRFQFELIPLLEKNAASAHRARVVCSLRDILVEKADAKAFEERVLKIVNRYYDLILVHADPACVRLEETFGRVPDIDPPIHYTGYVTRNHLDPQPHREAGRIVLSTGGGRVGVELIRAVFDAFGKIPHAGLRLHVHEGPFMESQDRETLRALASRDPRISWQPFSHVFLNVLAQAELSISMAGYNTCMDIIASGVKALVYPFPQNREQALRAERLESLGVLRILRSLDPNRLAAQIQEALSSPPPAPGRLKTNGAQETVRAIENLVLKA